jgi:hypothetical protein
MKSSTVSGRDRLADERVGALGGSGRVFGCEGVSEAPQ